VASHGGAVTGTHNFYEFADPKVYFEKHPDWYPLRNGKRQTDWAMGLCGTNEELARELAKNLMEKRMATWKDPTLPIAVAQGDGYTGCQCPICRALVASRDRMSWFTPVQWLIPAMIAFNRSTWFWNNSA
jgi:hypothetical protein